MKKYIILFLAATSLLACTGYSADLKKEEDKISTYIRKHNFRIVNDMQPMDTTWEQNVYYHYAPYGQYYFRLDQAGDSIYVDSEGDTTSLAFKVNDIVVLRYKRFTLDTINPDTVSYWPNDCETPIEVTYMQDLTITQAGTSGLSDLFLGRNKALRWMKYPNSMATIICPSKVGEDQAGTSVTPYGYIFWAIKVKDN